MAIGGGGAAISCSLSTSLVISVGSIRVVEMSVDVISPKSHPYYMYVPVCALSSSKAGLPKPGKGGGARTVCFFRRPVLEAFESLSSLSASSYSSNTDTLSEPGQK